MNHDCDDKPYSNTLMLTNNSMEGITRDGLINQKSSYTSMELNKIPTNSVFETNAVVNLKTPTKKPILTHKIRQIKHGHLTEEEEQEALNEECMKLLGHIEMLMTDISNCLKDNEKKTTRSIDEEMKIFMPIMEKISELKSLHKNVGEMMVTNLSSTSVANEQLKSIDVDFENRIGEMHKWQWKIEKLIPDNNALSPLFFCIRNLEEAIIFIRMISVNQIIKIDLSFINNIKESAKIFIKLNESSNVTVSSTGLPEIYLENFQERILAVDKELPKIIAYFEFIELFKQLNDETMIIEEKITESMSNYTNFDVLIKKFEELKRLIESKDVEMLKVKFKDLSAKASILINTYLTKKISSQMVVNQCIQRINDDITKILRSSEETLKLQKSLTQSWKNLNEKKVTLENWINHANIMKNRSKEEREQFLSKENNCDQIYQDYFKEKNSFPSLDMSATMFIEEECNSITTEWNFILSEFEKIGQKEIIESLKKEYFDRIDRIEKWLDKSETIAEKKIGCHKKEIEEVIEILEAATKNFDTVKNDLQRTAKVGEVMYKSNMSEKEVEEILGTMNVNKDRFINVRDKINAKVKKMKKLVSAAIIFDKNIEELNNWINSIEKIYIKFAASENPGESEFFQAWLNDYDKLFNEKTLKEIDERKGENLKILERIKEKIPDDVEINDSEATLLNISKVITKLINVKDQRKKENEFKHYHEKMKYMINSVDDQIEDEENLMNRNEDFSKILNYHQEFFEKGQKREMCNQIIVEMKRIKKDLEYSKSESDFTEYFNVIEELEGTCENTFAKVSEVQETLITLPEKINDFKEKLSNMSQWISSIQMLSTRLDMTDNQVNESNLITTPSLELRNAPSSIEYKATLTEFQQLTSLSTSKENIGEELTKFLATLTSSRPGLQLIEEVDQLKELRQKCQEIQPEIIKVLHKAPVIAKSIEFKEEVNKRNEKLLELKRNLENIPEEESYEEIEDIFEQEEKIMARLSLEAPDILNEIAECKELQANSETANLITSGPLDLESTWNDVNEAMKQRLAKLRDAKDAWMSVDNIVKETDKKLQNIHIDINNITIDISDIELAEIALQKLEELEEVLNIQISEDLKKLEQTIEIGGSKIAKLKCQDFIKQKESFICKQKENTDQVLMKIDEINMVIEIIKNVKRNNDNFARFLENMKDSINEIKERSKEVIHEELINDLKQFNVGVVNFQALQEKEYQNLIKKLSYENISLTQTIENAIITEQKEKNVILHDIEEVSKFVKSYIEHIAEINKIEDSIHIDLEDIKSQILEVEPQKLKLEKWKNCKSENLLRLIIAKLDKCERKVNHDLKNYVIKLKPEKEEINNNLSHFIDQLQNERYNLEEVKHSLDIGIGFINHYQKAIGNLQKNSKFLLDSLMKLDKNYQLGLRDKINAIEIVKTDINNSLENCTKLIQEVEENSAIFNSEIVGELTDNVNIYFQNLEERSEKCLDMIAIERKNEEQMNNIDDEINEIEIKIDDLETKLKTGETIFGDNSEHKSIIMKYVPCFDEINSSIEDIIISKEYLTKITKDKSLLKINDKIKYCKAKVNVVEKEMSEKMEFLDWIHKFAEKFQEISNDIQNEKNLIENLNETLFESVIKTFKVIKLNIENLKDILRNRKKLFPIFSLDNFRELSLNEMLLTLENEFIELNKSFDLEKKILIGFNEEMKGFEKKKKKFDDSVILLRKKVYDLKMGDCTLQLVTVTKRELNNNKKVSENFHTEISILEEIFNKLIENKPFQVQFPQEILEDSKIILEEVMKEIEQKTGNLDIIDNNLKEFNEIVENFQNKMKLSKLNFKGKILYDESEKMLDFFKSQNDHFQKTEDDFDGNLIKIEYCIEEIENVKKSFLNSSCKNLSSQKEKVKNEFKDWQETSKKYLKDMSVELEILDNVTKQIYILQRDLDDFIDNTKDFSAKLIEIKEEKLKNVKEKQKKIGETLMQKFIFLNLDSLKMKNNEILKGCDQSSDILKKLNENTKFILKEKELLTSKIKNIKEMFGKAVEEFRNLDQIENQSDKLQFEKVTSLIKTFHELLKDAELNEKKTENLYHNFQQPEIEKLLNEYKYLRNELQETYGRSVGLREKINCKIREEYEKAKRIHDEWMKEIEEKIQIANSSSSSNFDISSQIDALNQLLSSLNESEKVTPSVYIPLNTNQSFQEIGFDSYFETDIKRDSENRYTSMVSDILEKKKKLEEDFNETRLQRDKISEIDNVFLVNVKKLKEILQQNDLNVDVKRRRINEIENIEKVSETCVRALFQIEPKIRDSAIKEFLLKNISSHQSFLKEVKEEKVQSLKILNIHENILKDLQFLQNNIKERLNNFKPSWNHKAIIDQNYLNKLEFDIKNLTEFIKDCSLQKSEVESKCQKLMTDTVIPSDINIFLVAIHAIINGLGKQIEKINDEWKSGQEIMNDWHNTFDNFKESLEIIEKSMDQEIFLATDIKEKEEVVEILLAYKQRLDDYRTNIRNLDRISQNLNNPQLLTEFSQLKNQHKELQSQISKKHLQAQKNLHQHKEYATKITEIKRRFNFINIEDNKKLDYDSAKYTLEKLEKHSSKIQDQENELKRIQSLKNKICNESNGNGKEIINEQYDELMKEMNTKSRTISVKIEKLKNDLNKVNECEKQLFSIQTWIKNKGTFSIIDQWDSDIEIVKQKLIELKTFEDEMTLKYNDVQEVISILRLVSIGSTEVENTLDKIHRGIEDIESNIKESVKEGNEVKKGLMSVKDLQEHVNHKCEEFRKEFNIVNSLSNPNNIQNEIERIDIIIHSIQQLKSLHEEIHAVIEMLPKAKNIENIYTILSINLEKHVKESKSMENELIERKAYFQTKQDLFIQFTELCHVCTESLEDLLSVYHSIDKGLNPEENISKLEELFQKANNKRQQMNQMNAIAEKSDFNSCKETSKVLINQFAKFLDELNKDILTLQEESIFLKNFQVSMHNIETQIESNEYIMRNICVINFAEPEDISNSKLRALEIKKQTTQIHDKLYTLDQEFGKKVNLLTMKNRSIPFPSELKQRLTNLNKVSDKYIEKCDLEFNYITEYNESCRNLQDSISHLSSIIINVEKTVEHLPDQFEKLKNCKNEVVENETLLDKLKLAIKQSGILTRSQKFNLDLVKSEKSLIKLKTKYDNILSLAKKDKENRDKYEAKEHYFSEQLRIVQEKIELAERHSLNIPIVKELESLGCKMTQVYEEMTFFINDEMDHHSARYLEYSKDHRVRSNNLNTIQSKIHSFEYTLVQQKQHKERCNKRRYTVESNLKNIESQFGSLNNPKDLVQLQNNMINLKSILHELETIETELQSLVNDVSDNLQLENSCRDLMKRITSIKEKTQKILKDSHRAEIELKEHKLSINVAQDFLQQCNKRYEAICTKSSHHPQPENVLQKINELITSIEKNNYLLLKCSNIEIINLKPLSDHGIEVIENEINTLKKTFEALEESLDNLKSTLESAVQQNKEEKNLEESIITWLRKEKKNLKLMDQYENEDALKEYLILLQNLSQTLLSKQGDIDLLTQRRTSSLNFDHIKERSCNLLISIKAKITDVEITVDYFVTLRQKLDEWKKWYDKVYTLKGSLISLHDNDQRDVIGTIISEKEKRYDEMIFITSKVECLMSKLTTTGREKVRIEMKLVKDQWHEIFDDLLKMKESLEQKIQKNDSLKEILQRTKLQFDRIRTTFNEEIQEIEPVKIIFQIGIEDKERQLRIFEEIMQNASAMSYTIHKLETTIQSEDDTELEYEISSFVKEFYTLSSFINMAKNISSESYKNHTSFEDCFLQARDMIMIMKKKLELCQSVNGTSMSLQSRLERIQTILTKELINNDHQENKVFNNLSTIKDRMENTVGDIEKEIITEKLNNILTERKIIQEQMIEKRNELEKSFSNIEIFKANYDDLSAEITKVRHKLQHCSELEEVEIINLIEPINELTKTVSHIEEIALEILQTSDNQLPLHMTKNIQKQVEHLTSKHNQLLTNCKNLAILQDQYEKLEEELNNLIQNNKLLLEELINKWNNALNITECNNIIKEIKKMSSENVKTYLLSEELEKLLLRFHDFPTQCKKNTSRFSLIKVMQDSFYNTLNEIISSHKTELDEYKIIKDKITDIQEEIKAYNLTNNENLPETKLGKFNLINDLTCQKDHQNIFYKIINEINTKNIKKKKLSDYLTTEKVKIIKEIEMNVEEIEKRLKVLNSSILDQERLEKDIMEIKESLYCIGTTKLTLLSKFKPDSDGTENKINEIGKNINLIFAIKKQIDRNLISKQIGCYSEIQELQELKKNLENLEMDFHDYKEKFHIKINKLMYIENNIIKLEKNLQYFVEEMNALKTYGSTLDNKRVLLEKVKDFRLQISKEDENIQSLKAEIMEFRINIDETLEVEIIFEKLEKKYREIKEKNNRLIKDHEISILDHDKFERFIKEVKNDFCEIQNKLQNQDNEIDKNDIESIDSIRESYEEIILVGEKCQRTSSEEGHNMIMRQLENIKKNWKTIEQLHKQLKANIENKKLHSLELEKQQKQLKEWLNDITNSITKIKSFTPNNANDKRKKHLNSKNILSDIQEWKKEVNKYFDTLRESNQKESEIDMEMLKDYRHLLSNINVEVSESKEAVNIHLQFDREIEEIEKSLDSIENQILELKPQRTGNLDEIENHLKSYGNIHIKMMDYVSKIGKLNHDLSKLVPHTSRVCLEEYKTKIFQLEGRYEDLKTNLNISNKNAQIAKEQILKFESELKVFELWVSEMEGRFKTKSLLKDINEKEKKLKIYQDNLINIYDKKEDINKLLKTIKEMSLDLTIHHNLKRLQVRYSSLSNLAQGEVELVAKWDSTHRKFLQHQEEFYKELCKSENQIRILEGNIEVFKNVEELLQSIEGIEKGINNLNELKINYEAFYHHIIQETCSSGHENISQPFINYTKKHNEAILLMKSIKSEVCKRQSQESNIKYILENMNEWIKNFRKELSREKFSTVQILMIKSNISLLDTFMQNVNSKISFLENTKREHYAIKDEEIIKMLSKVENDLFSISKELNDLNTNTKILKEQNETYYQIYDSTKLWIENMNMNIQQISITKGTESEITERLNSAIEYRKSVSAQGQSLMRNIIDNANSFMKYLTEKSNKEIILEEVNKLEEEFLVLSKSSEETEENLNKVEKHWMDYKQNVDYLLKFIKTSQKKKQQLLEIQNTFGSDVDSCIEQLTELINDIAGEKMKLEILINQTHYLKELSQELQVEQTLHDFMDQLIEQEIDCKHQLDHLYQLKNGKETFDHHYHKTKECIQDMKSDLIVFDQLHNIPSFKEFQKHFSNFQIFETKTIVCERNLEDCSQIAHKLFTLCDGEKELEGMMKVVQKSWNNLKDKIGEINSRLSRLANIWAKLKNLYDAVEDWTNKSTSEIESFITRGYINEELKDKTIKRLKVLSSNGELIKPKLPKILDLFYKAESYTAFSKTEDPLILQKRFCDILENIWNFEKQLNSTQNNIDKFFEDASRIEKWIIETSSIITNKFNTTNRINSTEDIDNQLKFCLVLRQQIISFEEDKLKELLKLKEFLDKQLISRSPLKVTIDSKVSEIPQILKKLHSVNEKWKKSLKKRADKLKQFQNSIHSAENLIYKDFPDWWSTKEITTTLNPIDCDQQTKDSLILLDNVVSAESDFHHVWLDYIQQQQIRSVSQSMDADSKSSDSIMSQSIKITEDNHLDQIRAGLKTAKDRIRQRLEELKMHKTIWFQIEGSLDELESLFSQKFLDIDRIVNVQYEDEAMYEEFEKSIVEIISQRDVLDRIQEQINELNGNNDYNDVYSKKKYTKYQKICKDYAGLLHKIDMLKNNLRQLNANNVMKELLRSDIVNEFSQSLSKENLDQLYLENATQTNRNKATSIRSLKRHLSNPNLMLSKLREPTETMHDLRQSIDTGSMTSHSYLSKLVQTVKDKDVQSKNSCTTLSEYADRVMKDRTSFEKKEKMYSSSKKLNLQSNQKRELKEENFRRLSELLSTIQQIKDDVTSSKSFNSVTRRKSYMSETRSPTRNSMESVRHNVTQKSKKKRNPEKPKRSKSKESLGVRLSPTGCASPKSPKGEFPKKRSISPKKSSSRSSVNRLIAF